MCFFQSTPVGSLQTTMQEVVVSPNRDRHPTAAKVRFLSPIVTSFLRKIVFRVTQKMGTVDSADESATAWISFACLFASTKFSLLRSTVDSSYLSSCKNVLPPSPEFSTSLAGSTRRVGLRLPR